MTYASFDTNGASGASESYAGPVTCSTCGCRLERAAAGSWHHFSPMAGRDARGCKVGCADDAHDASGNATGSSAS